MRVTSRVGIGSFLRYWGGNSACSTSAPACSGQQGSGGFHPRRGAAETGRVAPRRITPDRRTAAASSAAAPSSAPVRAEAPARRINPDAACASSSTTASLVTLNMYIMFGMTRARCVRTTNGSTPSAALNAFFQDPGSAGLKVALRFFPDGQCTQGACDISACATPAVPMGALTSDPAPMDMQEAALVASVNAHMPDTGNGGTPMSAALQGAEVNYAIAAYEAAHPQVRKPSSCSSPTACRTAATRPSATSPTSCRAGGSSKAS